MKIRITLNNNAGELDGQTIDVRDDDDSAEISECIHSALETWVLSPGDTIKIEEVTEIARNLEPKSKTELIAEMPKVINLMTALRRSLGEDSQ